MNGLEPRGRCADGQKNQLCALLRRHSTDKCGKVWIFYETFFLGRRVLMFGCEEDFGLKNGSDKHCGKETSYTLLHISVATFMCLFPLFCV